MKSDNIIFIKGNREFDYGFSVSENRILLKRTVKDTQTRQEKDNWELEIPCHLRSKSVHSFVQAQAKKGLNNVIRILTESQRVFVNNWLDKMIGSL